MIDITLEKANQIRDAYATSGTNIKALEVTYQFNTMYMTVDRHLTGITEYRIVENTEESDKKLLDEFMETLAVFDTSKYTRTTEYIKQESKRLIQAVRDYDKHNKR